MKDAPSEGSGGVQLELGELVDTLPEMKQNT